MPGALLVLEQRRRIVHVAHHDVGVAVVVEIADGQPPAHAGDPQAGAGTFGHVAETSAEIEQDLVLLPEGLAELGVVVDVREDVSVGEEEIEPAIEIGVDERRAPAHAHECRARRCPAAALASSNWRPSRLR